MLFEAVLSLEVVIYMVLFKLMHFIKLNMFQYSIFSTLLLTDFYKDVNKTRKTREMGEVILSSALYSVTLCILRLGIYISQKNLAV